MTLLLVGGQMSTGLATSPTIAELRSQEERPAMPTSQPFNAFLRYINAASPSRRSSEVKKLRAESESDYDPRVDYWKRFRNAVATDLRTSCDGAAVHRAAENATATKRRNYAAAALKWLDVVGQWSDCDYVSPPREVLVLGGLQITVNPIAIERHPDGSLEVVALWLRADIPSPDTVAGCTDAPEYGVSGSYPSFDRPAAIRGAPLHPAPPRLAANMAGG